MPTDDKSSVEEAAADAARSIAERREMTRKSAEAEAADGAGETQELEDEAEEHRRATHEAEDQSEREAREADAGQ